MRYWFDTFMVIMLVVLALFMVLALSGCGPSLPRPDAAPPAVVTRDVLVPVRAACIDAKDLPPAAPATALNGGAKHDAAALAATDNLLRAQVAALLALIIPGCTR